MSDRAVVRAITALAHAFDMRVAAERVETAPQLQGIVAIGCDWGQGFLVGAARSASELAVYLDDAGDPSHEPLRKWNEPGVPTAAANVGIAPTNLLTPSRLANEPERS